MKSYYLIDIDNMGEYNILNSREEGDRLLHQVEEALNNLINGSDKKVVRNGDEFLIEKNIKVLKKCVEFGNKILSTISKLNVKATLVFTIDNIKSNRDININKLRIGIIKTKFHQRNIVGYIE